ncbi:MAG: PorP/SprF family type IX secretion system membrane protein [Bacteroidota bacterium]
MTKQIFLLTLFFFYSAITLFGQDHFFTHFYSNRSFFNPALTGIRGSSVIAIRYKNQWRSSGSVSPFSTYSANYEDAMICGPFDLGISVLQDQEGAGQLTTVVGGAQLAGSFNMGRFTFRPGLNLQFGQKSIDLSGLTFADQLNAKYGFEDAFGNPNSTTFVLPAGGGITNTYFAPVIGVAGQLLIPRKRPNREDIYILFGGAVHNAVQLDNRGLFGQEESLLNIGTLISRRIAVHASVEFYTKLGGNQFVAVRPQLLFQRQANLQYLESGVHFGLNNFLGLGVYYHATARQVDQGINTNWLSWQFEYSHFTRVSNGEARRIDFNFNFSNNLSGLKNSVGMLFEFGVAYHFSKSLLCSLNPSGASSHLSRNKTRVCPNQSRNKIYENIWYNNIIF